MPTTDVTNQLVANISSTEQSTSNVPINRGTGNPSFASNVGNFTTYYAIPGGNTALPLPIPVVTQVYIKNIDLTRPVTIIWTSVEGGASVHICELNIGDQIIYWANPVGATSPGISEVRVNGSAGTLIEYFLGG